MPTYDYFCNIHESFESEHKMSETLETCPFCDKEGIKSDPPKKLISKSNFILVGGGWAKEGYS